MRDPRHFVRDKEIDDILKQYYPEIDLETFPFEAITQQVITVKKHLKDSDLITTYTYVDGKLSCMMVERGEEIIMDIGIRLRDKKDDDSED